MLSGVYFGFFWTCSFSECVACQLHSMEIGTALCLHIKKRAFCLLARPTVIIQLQSFRVFSHVHLIAHSLSIVCSLRVTCTAPGLRWCRMFRMRAIVAGSLKWAVFQRSIEEIYPVHIIKNTNNGLSSKFFWSLDRTCRFLVQAQQCRFTNGRTLCTVSTARRACTNCTYLGPSSFLCILALLHSWHATTWW